MKSQKFHRCLFVLATIVTIVALFYAEENWRGKNAWEKYKQKRIAAGEHFEVKWFAPPPVPDNQNFYKTPFLRSIGYRTDHPGEVSSHLKAMNFCAIDFDEGKRADLKKAQDNLRHNTNYAMGTASSSPAADIVNAVHYIPELDELRRASELPYSQCYAFSSGPMEDIIPNFINLRNLSQILTISSIAHLEVNESDKAWQDSHVLQQIATGLHGNQTLVAAMVRVAISDLVTRTFWEGWADDKWDNQQLADFQNFFQSANLLADVDRAFHIEAVGLVEEFEKTSGRKLFTDWVATDKNPSHVFLPIAMRIMPRGWFWQNFLVRGQWQEKACGLCNGADKKISPANVESQQRALEGYLKPKSSSPLYLSPFSLLARVSIPNIQRACLFAARRQTSLNQAAIVCALERCRHENGRYPDSLAELAPRFMGAIPTDVINGGPMRYRHDGSRFLLYSVGWNEKDDGGVWNTNMERGDWAWRYPESN